MQDSASCSDSSFYEQEEMKSSRNKKEIKVPRIGPGLMMSKINRYEADWPIWRHFIEGQNAQGEKHVHREQHSQKEQYGQKKQHTEDYPPGRRGGGGVCCT
jgi:hypothetical protein